MVRAHRRERLAGHSEVAVAQVELDRRRWPPLLSRLNCRPWSVPMARRSAGKSLGLIVKNTFTPTLAIAPSVLAKLRAQRAYVAEMRLKLAPH